MFFSQAVQSLFASHPPINERVARVENVDVASIAAPQVEHVLQIHERNNLGSFSLLMMVKNNDRSSVYLFGENIWRWRTKVFIDHQSFEKFDNFIGALVQNLSSKKKKERLTIDYKSFYYSNEIVKFNAQFFDENYQFDPNANLQIELENDHRNTDLNSRFLLRNKFL